MNYLEHFNLKNKLIICSIILILYNKFAIATTDYCNLEEASRCKYHLGCILKVLFKILS